MPKKITALTISEVSSVDEPANEGALVMLLKRKDPDNMTTDIYKNVLPSNLDELLSGGIDAVLVEKSGPSKLQKVSAWLRLRDDAANHGKDSVVKGLEADPPTVSDIDLAIGELTRSVQKGGENYHAAFERVIGSRFVGELYSHRCEMDAAGNNPAVYAEHRAQWRAQQRGRR